MWALNNAAIKSSGCCAGFLLEADIGLALRGPRRLETIQAAWGPAHSPGIQPMPTFSLAPELRNGIQPLPQLRSARPSSLSAAAFTVGVESVAAATIPWRIQGRSAAIKRHDSSDSNISERARGHSSDLGGFRRKGHRSFGILGLAGGSVRDSLPCHRHYPLPRFALRRLQACRRGMRAHRRLGAKSDRPARNRPLDAPVSAGSTWSWWSAWRWGRSVADCVDTLGNNILAVPPHRRLR